MVKRLVDKDEWYPVYSVNERYGREAEFTVDELQRIESAFAEFDAVQDLIAHRFE